MSSFEKYLKYKKKYLNLSKKIQKGRGTNSLLTPLCKKVLETEETVDPDTCRDIVNSLTIDDLKAHVDFLTMNPHGVLNDRVFFLPKNTYLAFTTNAGFIGMSSFTTPSKKDFLLDKFMYKAGDDSMMEDVWWSERLEEIKTNTFLSEILYSNDVNTLGNPFSGITSIYEPLDLVQDLDLVFYDSSNQQLVGPWGIWKTPINNHVRDIINQVNERPIKAAKFREMFRYGTIGDEWNTFYDLHEKNSNFDNFIKNDLNSLHPILTPSDKKLISSYKKLLSSLERFYIITRTLSTVNPKELQDLFIIIKEKFEEYNKLCSEVGIDDNIINLYHIISLSPHISDPQSIFIKMVETALELEQVLGSSELMLAHFRQIEYKLRAQSAEQLSGKRVLGQGEGKDNDLRYLEPDINYDQVIAETQEYIHEPRQRPSPLDELFHSPETEKNNTKLSVVLKQLITSLDPNKLHVIVINVCRGPTSDSSHTNIWDFDPSEAIGLKQLNTTERFDRSGTNLSLERSLSIGVRNEPNSDHVYLNRHNLQDLLDLNILPRNASRIVSKEGYPTFNSEQLYRIVQLFRKPGTYEMLSKEEIKAKEPVLIKEGKLNSLR